MISHLTTRVISFMLVLGFFFSCGSSSTQISHADYLNQGKYTQAVQLTDSLLSSDSDNPEYLYQHLISLHFNLLNTTDSLQHHALDYTTTYQFGDSLFTADQRDGSLRRIQDLYVSTYNKLSTKTTEGRTEQDSLSVALNLQRARALQTIYPDSLLPLQLTGDALIKLSKMRDAYSVYRSIVADSAYTPDALTESRLGLTLISRGDTAEAVKQFQSVLNLPDATLDHGTSTLMLQLFSERNNWRLFFQTLTGISPNRKSPAFIQTMLGPIRTIVSQSDSSRIDTDQLLTAYDQSGLTERQFLTPDSLNQYQLPASLDSILYIGNNLIAAFQPNSPEARSVLGSYYQNVATGLLHRAATVTTRKGQLPYIRHASFYYEKAVPMLMSAPPTMGENPTFWKQIADIYAFIGQESRAASIRQDLSNLN